jgi:hypothetical protein
MTYIESYFTPLEYTFAALRLTPTIKGIFEGQIGLCLTSTVDALSIHCSNFQQGNAFGQWRVVVGEW